MLQNTRPTRNGTPIFYNALLAIDIRGAFLRQQIEIINRIRRRAREEGTDRTRFPSITECNNGYEAYALGVEYLYGNPADFLKAREYLEKAVTLKQPYAHYFLYIMYKEGSGFAHPQFKKAAQQLDLLFKSALSLLSWGTRNDLFEVYYQEAANLDEYMSYQQAMKLVTLSKYRDIAIAALT